MTVSKQVMIGLDDKEPCQVCGKPKTARCPDCGILVCLEDDGEYCWDCQDRRAPGGDTSNGNGPGLDDNDPVFNDDEDKEE